MDNIIVSDARELFDLGVINDYVPSISKHPISGDYAPYGYAGFVVNECVLVCHQCLKESDTSLGDNPSTENFVKTLEGKRDIDPYPIFGDSEWDFPASCEDCGKYLDVNYLIYKDNHYDIWNMLAIYHEGTNYIIGPSEKNYYEVDVIELSENYATIEHLEPIGNSIAEGEIYEKIPLDSFKVVIESRKE